MGVILFIVGVGIWFVAVNKSPVTTLAITAGLGYWAINNL